MNIDIILNNPESAAPGYVPWGIIRAQGADTVKFLQGQLTQDVALMGAGQARLAAWCSAKGRMVASFVVLKNSTEDFLLLCSLDLLPATLKRLQMFVMRAQCKLVDASGDYQVRGLTGSLAAAAFLGDASVGPSATNSIAAYAIDTANNGYLVHQNGSVSTIQLPPGHHGGQPVARALVIAPAAAPAREAVDLASDLALWQYLEITSGIARITQPIVDAFVPQMLNYESVGGVNFKKGCYPGQEVVARSQFRGTLKRRAYLAMSDAPLVAGAEVFNSGHPEQPDGTVAAAAPWPIDANSSLSPTHQPTRYAAVISIRVDATETGSLHLASADGPLVTLMALPYPLLADI